MTNTKKKYALYTICDDKYIEPCTTMLYSFLYNNGWYKGDIIVICDDNICQLTEDSKEKLKKIYNNIKILEVKSKNYEKIFENTESFSTKSLISCWYKFELFKKSEYDRIVWLDSDIIVKEDVSDLFEVKNKFVCCEDKLSTSNTYFNAGVFSLKSNKSSNKMYDNLLKFSEKVKPSDFKNLNSFKGRYNEQDVLNEKIYELFGDVCFLNKYIYNLPQQEESDEAIKNAKIIHFCGSGKPWEYTKQRKCYDYYYLYNELKYKSREVSVFGFNHKKTEYPAHEDYFNTPLQVGRARNLNNIVYPLHDSMLVNIGDKNRIYLETTGIYWIWKNIKSDIKGHEHYRRRWNLSESEIKEILRTHDIILPKKYDFGTSVRNHYAYSHSLLDILTMEEVVKKIHPEYSDDWDKIINNGHYFYYSNLFIAKREVYDKMCEFLFTVLNEFFYVWHLSNDDMVREHVILFSKNTLPPDHNREGMKWYEYQMEVAAFLCERLINLYVAHNFKNVYESEIVQMEICGA